MVEFEKFEDMMEEIVQTMPEVFFRELNGGVFAREAVLIHPESRGEELLIMGQYCVQPHLGRFIVLYYGSFMRVYGSLSEEDLRKEMRRVILHEFRHHLESLAGERDLEIEDAVEIAKYKAQGEKYKFREACPEDGETVAQIEQICFPPNEACLPVHMKERLAAAPELFLLAVERKTGRIAGFLNGIATDETRFRDEFFTDATLHRYGGRNVMLLGLDVLPEYRRQGLATELVARYAGREKAKGRDRLVLTCLEDKVEMYRKMGFRDLGLSASVWGGEAWHEMTMDLRRQSVNPL